MDNLTQKARFLKSEFTARLAKLDPVASRLWGKMNVQQMIEHMSDAVRLASGRKAQACITPADRLPKMQAFLMSEKPFQENTPNSQLPDTPAPPKYAAIEHAIDDLQQELDHFFEVFEKEPKKKVTNPFFGDLDYDMSIQLLHKHAIHHLKQFGAA